MQKRFPRTPSKKLSNKKRIKFVKKESKCSPFFLSYKVAQKDISRLRKTKSNIIGGVSTHSMTEIKLNNSPMLSAVFPMPSESFIVM